MPRLLPIMIAAASGVMVLMSGCAQTSVASTKNPIEAMPAAEYTRLITKFTRGTNQYAGLYQTFQADVTILNSEVQNAVVRQRANFKGWDEKQFQMEREKALQEASAYSKFFLRFYAPEHDYDDLDKPKTIWKLYLEYSGSRFEGKVKKVPEKAVETATLFPQMDRFSTPYEVTFSVPMTTIENGATKFVMTSSLGTAEFTFPAK